MHVIYLDNNATTAVVPEVAQAMLPWLTEQYGNPSSLHRMGDAAAEAVARARAQVARLIGARSPREIVFTSGGTESDQTAILSAARARSPRRRIVTSAVEHAAVLATLERLELEGWEIVRIGVEPSGALCVDDFVNALDDSVALATAMWVNNETGVVHALDTIGTAARARRIPFHVDGVQAVGKLALRVRDLPIDTLAISAHKLHGPKGVGALYVRSGTPFEPWIVGGPQEEDRRAGTENVPGIVGLGRAAELAQAWLASPGARELSLLRDRLERELVHAIDGARIAGAGEPRSPGTTQLIVGDVSGEALVMLLADEGLCASSGSACSAGRSAPSHVLAAMGCAPAEASSSLRLSLSRLSTAADVAVAVAQVPRAVEMLRGLAGTARSVPNPSGLDRSQG